MQSRGPEQGAPPAAGGSVAASGGRTSAGAGRAAARDAGSFEAQEGTLSPRENRARGGAGQVAFGDDEAPVVGRAFTLGGRRPYDVIQDHITAMAATLQQLKDGELAAIQAFVNDMQFSDSTQADPEVLGVIFKTVGRELWSAFVDWAGPATQMLPAGFLIAPAERLITAVTNEMERASAAQTSVSTARYVSSLSSRTTDTYQAQIADIVTSGPRILAHYQGLDGNEGAAVTGAKAELLRSLHTSAQEMPRRLPASSAYQARFIARYVNSRGGRIVATYDTDEDDGRYTFTRDSVELSGTPNAGHAADMLTRVMLQQQKRLWQLGVPLEVRLIGPNISGGTGPTTFMVREQGPDANATSGINEMDRRWRELVARGTLESVARITG